MQPLKITLAQQGLTAQEGVFTFILAGDVSFATITRKTAKVINFKTMKNVVIDLSQVQTTDSAGLALLIEWIKLSKAHNAQLEFKHIPAQLLTLAQLSDFDQNTYFSSSLAELALAEKSA